MEEKIGKGYLFKISDGSERDIFRAYISQFTTVEEALSSIGLHSKNSNSYGVMRDKIRDGKKLLELVQWYRVLCKLGLASPSITDSLYFTLQPVDLSACKSEEEAAPYLANLDYMNTSSILDKNVNPDNLPSGLNEFDGEDTSQ